MKQIKFEVIKIRPELGLALNVFYVGREFKKGKYDLKGSPLANRYQIRKDDSNRNEVIAKYKKWLWQQINIGKKGGKSKAYNELLRILEYQKKFGSVCYIACWCKPKPCHGDAIVEALKHLSNHA